MLQGKGGRILCKFTTKDNRIVNKEIESARKVKQNLQGFQHGGKHRKKCNTHTKTVQENFKYLR